MTTNCVVSLQQVYYERWVKLIDTRNKGSPDGANAVMSSFAWVAMKLELTILRSSIEAAGISFGSAFICILIFTRSLSRTVLIFLMVLGQIMLLLAVMTWMLDWPIGIVESISLSIFVGFSIDYPLHVAMAVSSARGSTPLSKLKNGLVEIGSPVFAAAATTFGAAIFLLFCELVPFVQIGSVLSSNTLLSCITSLVVLPCALLIIDGKRAPQILTPQDDVGTTVQNEMGAGNQHEETDLEHSPHCGDGAGDGDSDVDMIGELAARVNEKQSAAAAAPPTEAQRVVVILTGPPGAGKGTQALLIAEALGIPQISTGVLLRAAAASTTDVGRHVKEVMESGGLVSDEVVVGMLAARMQETDGANGIILDGFPRTPEQATALDAMLSQTNGNSIVYVIAFEAAADVLVARICGRRVHEASGRVYHVVNKPPLSLAAGATPSADNLLDDETGEPLAQRADDNEAAFTRRLEEYQALSAPLLAHYEPSGVVARVDASAEADLVWAEVRQLLPERQP